MLQNLDRYQKQYLFEPLGKEGQRKICDSQVLVIGCGALGCAISNILVRAGVGFVKIVDRDIVEIANLHRQILFDEQDAAERLPKAVAAAQKLRSANSQVEIEPVVCDVDFRNVEMLVRDVDLVMDGTDNFETRFLINEVCVKSKKPWIYGACVGSEGMVMAIIPHETACLRCVFETAPSPEMAPTCDTAGILATTVLNTASYQCTEALKILSGRKETVSRSLYRFDIWKRQEKQLPLEGFNQKSDCAVCRKGKCELLEGKNVSKTSVLCGRNSVQIISSQNKQADLKVLASRLEKAGKVVSNDYLVQAGIEGYQITVFPDGRTMIKGTDDPAVARTLYSKYVSA